MDKKRLNKEQQKLIVNNYKLLRNFISKIISSKDMPKYLEDEFISDTFFRFCISAMKFNKDSGFKFSTYAYGGFNFALRYVLNNKKEQFSKMNYVEDFKKYKLEYEKSSVVGVDFLDDFINKVDLNSRDKFIVMDYFYNHLSLRKIGEKHRMSGEAIRLIIKRSLKKIRTVANRRKLSIDDFYI